MSSVPRWAVAAMSVLAAGVVFLGLYAVSLETRISTDILAMETRLGDRLAKLDQNLTVDLRVLSRELNVRDAEAENRLGGLVAGLRRAIGEASARSSATDTALLEQLSVQDQALRQDLGALSETTARLATDIQAVSDVTSDIQALSAVTSGGQASSPSVVWDANQVYSQAAPAVFYLETLDGTGTGWLVEPGLILTVEHVLAGSSKVTVRRRGGLPFTATVVAIDSLRDIALLRFDSRLTGTDRIAPLPLGDISVTEIAKPLIALGYSGVSVTERGGVGDAAANVGVLSQIANFGSSRGGKNLMMDAPIDPGDSGGPVLDALGRVVGMVRAAQEETDGGQRVVGTFFAVHVDEIRAALPALKDGQSR